MLNVVDPEAVTVDGLKLADAPAGNPDVEKDTTPPKPFTGLTVTRYVAVPPTTLDGFAPPANAKSGADVTVSVGLSVLLGVPLDDPVTVKG